jgi:hypothetical protein
MIMSNGFGRTITVPDPDGSLIEVWGCNEALSVSLFALASAAASSLTGRIFAFNADHALVGISEQMTFTTLAAPDFAGAWSGTPNFCPSQNVEGIAQIGFKADVVTGGPWLVRVAVSYRVED